jgi:ABC-type nitrate/sulfonate/bicarbonate transport system substrate-binding protein
MKGRWLLTALTAPLVLLPLLAAAPAPQKGLRTLRLNVFQLDAGTIAARNLGYFAAEGLAVDIIVTPNSTDQFRGLGDGRFDLASTAFDNVLAWSGREGAEFIAVAQNESGSYLPFYVRPEIRDWADLRGRPLAVDAVDTAYALVLRRILLAHDLDFERGDYELVPVGQTGLRVESLARGDTFAAILSAPFDAQAEAAGMRKLTDHREVLPDYPGLLIADNRAWAPANRDVLVRYLRAWRVGAAWVAANHDAAVQMLAADQNISPAAAAARMALLSPDGALNGAGLESTLDLRTRFGFVLPLGTDLNRFYDVSYWQAAGGR